MATWYPACQGGVVNASCALACTLQVEVDPTDPTRVLGRSRWIPLIPHVYFAGRGGSHRGCGVLFVACNQRITRLPAMGTGGVPHHIWFVSQAPFAIAAAVCGSDHLKRCSCLGHYLGHCLGHYRFKLGWRTSTLEYPEGPCMAAALCGTKAWWRAKRCVALRLGGEPSAVWH